MTEDLTELRRLQAAAQLEGGIETAEAKKGYADAIADLVRENEQQRVQALYQDALSSRKKVSGSTGPAPSDPDTSKYKIVNKNNEKGIQVGQGGMSWDDLAEAVQNGTVQEIIDHDTQTISYVPAK